MEKPKSSRILLAHQDESVRDALRLMLEDALGHTVTDCVERGADLLQAYVADVPDLVVTSVELSDGEAIEYLLRASEHEPRPTIVVTSRADLEHVEQALEDHVMSYLVEPVTPDDLRPSIRLVLRRFAEFQQLREEVQGLNEALRARKLIEKAKGWLMAEKDLDESEAHKHLQELASSKRTKLIDIAESILRAAGL